MPDPIQNPAAPVKKFRSQFFRVAVEGDTADGRVIEARWIQEAADTFDPKTYGARIWLEHYRGIFADSVFPALGDVTALKALTDEINGQKKLCLYAQIDPTQALVDINKARQKIYTSIEIDPNFAKTGKAYLVGLAVTDSPASLGTEALAFSAAHPDSALAKAKQRPENVFTAAVETELSFSEISDDPQSHAGFFQKIKDYFKKAKDDQQMTDYNLNEFSQSIDFMAQEFAQTKTQTAELKTELTKTSDALKQLEEKFNALQTKLSLTPADEPRPPHTGSNATDIGQVDC